jgi:DNA-binding NtrC family response regulator
VEQAFVLAQGSKIYLEDLPLHVRSAECNMETYIDGDSLNLHDAVENIEKMMILRALRIHRTQRKAALFLGINQSTLARKAKRYGIKGDAIVHQDE